MPRPVLAELTQKLTNAGAALIVFDVVFAEPDQHIARTVHAGLETHRRPRQSGQDPHRHRHSA